MNWRRAAGVWLGLALWMIVQGVAREALLAPSVGALAAHQLGSIAAVLVVIGVSAATLRWIGATTARAQLQLGLAWLASTLLFELVFGHWIAGHSWSRLLADYDLGAGRLWPLVLLATLGAPRLAGWLLAPRVGR